MDLSLHLLDWAAWAPGLQGQAAWRAWASGPHLPSGNGAPDLPEVPAMQRRRLSTMGRAVLRVLHDVQPRPDSPAVFASRYGDVQRALRAFESLLAGEPLSPTDFASSVHNGVAAQCAIIDNWPQNMVCVAAGEASAAAGAVEAAGLLADGAEEVLLVCYDEPLPAPYDDYAQSPQATYAWAWRLAARSAGPCLRLSARAAPAAPGAALPARPAGLEVLRWLLSGEARLQQQAGATQWLWQRDA